MNADELKALQAPLKERYRSEPETAVVTMSATGTLDSDAVICHVKTHTGSANAGLHSAAGGDAKRVGGKTSGSDVTRTELLLAHLRVGATASVFSGKTRPEDGFPPEGWHRPVSCLARLHAAAGGCDPDFEVVASGFDPISPACMSPQSDTFRAGPPPSDSPR